MKRVAQALSVPVLMVGLAAGDTLMAAHQDISKQTSRPAAKEVPKQRSRPVIQKVPKQTNKPVTALDQNIYKQQSQVLKMQIKEDQKRLKASQRQYGKDHPTVKADRKQLQKNEKALKQLRQTRKKGSRK